MYKKNILEKFGDFLSHPGKRFLFGLLTAWTIWPFGLYIGLAILEHTKTYFVSGVSVKLSNGEVIPCTIVKKKYYCYWPVVPFVCLFFYIPYKTQYYLVKNIAAPDIPSNTKFDGIFLECQLLNAEPIPYAKAKAIMTEPQCVAEELEKEIPSLREQFCSDMKPFFENELIEEIYHTNQLSICKSYEDDHLLFHYSKLNNSQTCMIIKEDFVEQIKDDSTFLFTSYLASNPDAIVAMTDSLLERLLRLREDKKSEITQSKLEELDSKKELLTKDTIFKTIKKGCTWDIVCGSILCFLSVGGFEIAIFGLVSSMFILAPLGIALGCFLLHRGIRLIKVGKHRKLDVLMGNYKIIKTKCSKIIDNCTDESISYTYEFENGENLKVAASLGSVGDDFYMVYLEGTKKVNAYFSGMQYYPAQDLDIE